METAKVGLDFEDVNVGSIIIVAKMPPIHMATYLEVGDIWVVEAMHGRPRVAFIKRLSDNALDEMRVDHMLMLDDVDTIMIGPSDKTSRTV